WYPKDSPFDLVAYSDSDYAGASLDRKSTIRGCQFLRCILISWQCCSLWNMVIETSATYILSDDPLITTNGVQLTMSNPQERVDSP
nr:putative ribonuclease H-like domain-containing protein [Tanacetum cinerariifolium]